MKAMPVYLFSLLYLVAVNEEPLRRLLQTGTNILPWSSSGNLLLIERNMLHLRVDCDLLSTALAEPLSRIFSTVPITGAIPRCNYE